MSQTFVVQLIDDNITETFGPYYSPQDALLAFHQTGLEMQASLPSITPLLNYSYLLKPNDRGYKYAVFNEMRLIRSIRVDTGKAT